MGYGGQSGNHAQAREGKYRGSIASNFSINRFRVFAGMLVLSILGATVPSTAKGPIPAFAGGDPSSAPKGEQTAVLAGGCFWGVYAVFRQLKGVENVVAGYSGGSAATAHYEVVSAGGTGHAEPVKATAEILRYPSTLAQGREQIRISAQDDSHLIFAQLPPAGAGCPRVFSGNQLAQLGET
jgi:hypothetical protein